MKPSPAIQLLQRLQSLEVRLESRGDRLRVSAAEGVVSPQLRDEIAQHKKDLLELLGEEHTAVPPLVPGERHSVLPLSLAQKRLWFLHTLVSGDAYNLPLVLSLEGALSTQALARALTAIGERHETLRTTFALVDGEPTQRIGPVTELDLPLVDLAAEPPADVEAAAREHARAFLATPFDLEQGPVWRARLLCLAPTRHWLLIAVHHIASDGWSLGVLQRELAAGYQAFQTEEPSPLPALPVQYADFTIWQHEWLSGERLDQRLAYWRDQLADAPTLHSLPLDRPRPAEQRFVGEHLHFSLDSALTAGLRRLSRAHGATLFMTLLAGFTALLARHAGQTEWVIGTPVANRAHPELEPLIGFFVNTLALRLRWDGDPPWSALLAQVRETALQAYAHQELPFERLVEALNPERSLSHEPLVQIVFALQNTPAPSWALEGLEVTRVMLPSQATRFELECYLREVDDHLEGVWVFNTDLFEREKIRRLLGHYETLLAGAVADPEQAISRLPLLGEGERRQLLEFGRGPAAAERAEATLSGLFEAQARRTPDTVAVVCEGERLSYRELDERANRLARHLRMLGVGPGVLVGVCLERSLELVVGLLGILKAGGAYVPLDPGFPAERLALVLTDAEMPVLVTQESLREGLPEHQAEVVSLDGDGERLAAHAAGPLERAAGAEDLAYVIYTSGSTGKPKGVQIPHRAVVNFLTAMQREPGLGPEDVLLAVTTLSFDIAVLEIFLPLCCGARVVVVSQEMAVDGEALAALLSSAGATVMQATPTTWRLLVETGWSGDGRLKALCGGEDWGWDLAAALLARCGSVWNMYGPTETTIWSAVRQLQAGDERVAIGGPIADTQLYVLDEHLQPVPVGVPGELHIGGAGVARGYWNRPELTAERFVADPFNADGRLYRTGDQVRYRADGSLEFLGRLDHQVKLRGYRIELGEIEAVLATHPGVKQAVVLVREDVPGDQRLVAYLMADPEPDTSELRNLARSRLPEYMVPTAWVTMEAFPLTPNRKVDRKALPAPEGLGVAPEAEYLAPRTTYEEMLAGIWAEVLGLERIGVRDNFFDVGGHSLLATQVIARLRDGLGVEVPLRALFEGPTVAELARRVATLREAGRGLEAPPLLRTPRVRDRPLALSFAQQRLWFLDQLEPGQSAYHVGWAVRLAGDLEVGALEQALSAIVDRHEVLRTTFAADEDGEPVQVIAPAGEGELEQVDLASLAAAERDAELQRQTGERANRPFDLATGPLLRATLYRLAPEEHVLALTIHHIAFDGWSFGVLARELGALYAALAEGREPVLPGLPIQYADYAAWQRQWLQGEVLEAQLEYWRRQLGPELPVLELPTDHTRPAQQSFAGARESYALSEPLVAALRSLSQREGVTLFMTLAAGLKVLFHRYSGQSVITIGTPVANRTRSELEPLIGFFVNSLVLSTELEGELSFREALARVCEVSLGAYAHQDLPFEQLVEAVRPKRDPSRHPLFQVMFALQNIPFEPMGLPGLKLSALPVERSSSQFELTLFAREGDGGLRLYAVYNRDLFERETIRRLLGHYETLLVGAVADPEQAISRLPLLSEAERQQLLVDWNATKMLYPYDACIHDLFENQAKQTPDAVALVCGEDSLTYDELNTRANQVGHYLQRRGVGPEIRAGLCLSRSIEMIVAVLGVLKAGGAYVPMDPKSPRERLASVTQDADLLLILTEEKFRECVSGLGVEHVCLDADGSAIGREKDSTPQSRASADSLAYVIFTSGSTGRPKGVEVEHRQVLNYVDGVLEQLRLPAGSGFAMVSPLTADLGYTMLYPALATGGTLHVISEERGLDATALGAYFQRHRPDCLKIVPSHLAALLMGPNPAEVLPEKCLVLGGETCTWDLVEKIRSLRPGCRVINHYGPTETTVGVMTHRVEATDLTAGRSPSVPIGRPLPNSQVYILDSHNNPVPLGVAGEVYIGGRGLARGYADAPELTAEKFVPHPYSEEPGARLYRTGDRARFRTGGTIEFLGRIDHQVKLRGFRIELGEIETALNQHQRVDAAVVAVREKEGGEKKLVAYVVPGQGPLSADDLRQFLRQNLPEYMVPTAFVMLESLPLTPNGKVDRRHLPEPDDSLTGPWASLVPPRNPIEATLAEIWGGLLEVEQVGVHDDFFDLGGHSLLATRVVSRVRQEFNVDLQLRQFLNMPTIAELANGLEGLLWINAGRPGGDEADLQEREEGAV